MASQDPLTTTAPEIVRDESVCEIRFNVMPDRPVEEQLRLKEYRVWDRYVEAQFDRTYRSTMEKSPDHLIFLTALTHSQKMIYLALCREFGFAYKPQGKELLKIWPTKVEVRMPKLCDDTEDVVQELRILELKQFDAMTYKVRIESRVGGAIHIAAECPVYLLRAPMEKSA